MFHAPDLNAVLFTMSFVQLPAVLAASCDASLPTVLAGFWIMSCHGLCSTE
jgi:hypothetical protein